MKLSDNIQAQRDFFYSGETKKTGFRKEKLRKLLSVIEKEQESICHALYKDLNKSEYESYITEISLVKQEIKKAIKKMDKWIKPNKKKMSLYTMPNKSYTVYEPYGVVLILSPWNYPFLLSMLPLVGAIAAGNCAIVKLSKNSIHTSNVIGRMLMNNFENHYISVVEDKIPNDKILEYKYDYIFFTGSTRVGKIVMREAASNLTPVSLELGGKSPCIVDKSANIKKAVKKILWAKTINAGQTCVAPDYVVVHEEIKEEFLAEMRKELEENYKDFEIKEDYPKIINLHHFIRLRNLIEKEKNVIGGKSNESNLKIAPAIVPDAGFFSETMKDEIFGPILPVLSYYQLEALLEELKKRPKPLACYIFSKNKKMIDVINTEFSYGGGCINDCIIHLVNENLPFGGVGNSGMGAYHGYYTFKTFSHEKSILVNTGLVDSCYRFRPFTKKKLKQLRKLSGEK